MYRARDARLGREVAIKLLLEEVANDPERLTRFEREARVLASLNHPHIATLHGFERTATPVPGHGAGRGRDPRRSHRARDLPIAEAIAFFLRSPRASRRRTSEASFTVTSSRRTSSCQGARLRRCRCQHRREDPRLRSRQGDGRRNRGGDRSLSHSPTLTLAATQRGRSWAPPPTCRRSRHGAAGRPSRRRLGLRGLPVRGAYREAGIRRRERVAGAGVGAQGRPRLEALPAQAPPALRRLLRRCLAKSARARLPHIGAARLELEEALIEARAPGPSADAVVHAHPSRRRVALAAGVALALALGFALGAAVTSVRASGGSRRSTPWRTRLCGTRSASQSCGRGWWPKTASSAFHPMGRSSPSPPASDPAAASICGGGEASTSSP